MNKLNNKIIDIEEFKATESCVLKSVQLPVRFPLSEEDKDIISCLKEHCLKLEGVGLAAPQIGINRSIAVIYIPESAGLFRDNVIPFPIHTIINPNYDPIIEEGISEDFEGCYSVSSCMGMVKRFNSIRVSYHNELGDKINKVETGFYARVLQHEIDHLKGVLIIDRFDESSLYGPLAEIIKIRRQKMSPEKQKEYDILITKKGFNIENDV